MDPCGGLRSSPWAAPQGRGAAAFAHQVTEANGITLHLDPRRTTPGYSGTGYKGVFDDYWPSGFKRDRPYTVQHDGKYQGRFPLVIEAALHYAKLELGIAPSREEQKEEQSRLRQEERAQRQEGRALTLAKQQNVWPPRPKPRPKASEAAEPPPRFATGPSAPPPKRLQAHERPPPFHQG